MKYLLDTHTLLWLLEGDERLSQRAREIIGDIDQQLFASVASLWEITIKVSIGKLKISKGIREVANALTVLDIKTVPVLPQHLEVLGTLPFHHRDPFDRLIIAQAKYEQMTIIGKDSAFKE